jgi:hypothetical protein
MSRVTQDSRGRRVDPPSSEACRAVRRESMRRRRAAAATLRSLYPEVRSIRLELRFESASGWTPADLTHALYPSAPAYFHFECPFGDCDGAFDIETLVAAAVAAGDAAVSGHQSCAGSRAAPAQQRRPCGLVAHHRVTVQYVADPG